MNVNLYNTTVYKNETAFRRGKNKPNSNPIKPNFQKAQMNVSSLITKDYRKKDDFSVRKNKPNSNPISVKPKMSANLYVIEDYENETAFRLRKNKPKQSQSPHPLSSVSSLLFLSTMDCKIVNIEDTPFVRRNQLLFVSARANVTAQPAAIITIRAKMMYLNLTSLKKRSKKRKYTPKTAITKAKNAITTSTQHNNAQAGWIKNASKILLWAKASVAVVIPQVGQGSPYLCWNPQ